MLARSQYISSSLAAQPTGAQHVSRRSCVLAPSSQVCNSRAVVCAAKSTSSNGNGNESSSSSSSRDRKRADPGNAGSEGVRQHSTPGSSSSSNRRPSSSDSPAGSKLPGNAGRAGQGSSNEAAPSRPAQNSTDSSKQQEASRPAHTSGRGGREGRGGRGGSARGGRGSGLATTSSSRSGKQLPLWLQQSMQLADAIKAADRPEQLLQLVQQHAAGFNHIHLSAAYTRAVKLCRQGVPLEQQPANVQQLLQLLHGLAEQLQGKCEARQLANIIWSCGHLSKADTASMLLPVFVQDGNLQQAQPQGVSNVMWSAATLELQMTPQQVQQLLQVLAAMAPQVVPQAVSNTLWAVAAMQQQVPQQQLQRLMQLFQKVLSRAKPQEVANTLWALATMQQQQVPQGQLQQMLLHFHQVLPQAKPQDFSNTLWACGKLQYAPAQLLSALEQHPQQLQVVLAIADPQALTNMAWACGQLGYRGKLLPGVLLQQAVELLSDSSARGCFKMQELCNLCWSAAVLDMRQLVPQVLQLAAASAQLWGTSKSEDFQQLYQVHLWLLDSQLPALGQGLSGVLSQQQLEQCSASWEQQVDNRRQEATSDLQQLVYAAVQGLPPVLWQQQPAAERVTADGVLSIDIEATTASGVKVAIEVDGPSHFIQPGNTLEGGTMFRNRALAARGYTVISIPYWEWNAVQGAEQKQQYLLTKLQPALQPADA